MFDLVGDHIEGIVMAHYVAFLSTLNNCTFFTIASCFARLAEISCTEKREHSKRLNSCLILSSPAISHPTVALNNKWGETLCLEPTHSHNLQLHRPDVLLLQTHKTRYVRVQRFWVMGGQCCPILAAGPCLPNGPISQLSPHLTRNPCTAWNAEKSLRPP